MSLVIPIRDAGACNLARPLAVQDPLLVGPSAVVGDIVRTLKPLVDAELGAEVPAGAWLRALRVEADEAVLTIAPDLACHGHAVAALAFDVMRRVLPDTDIYVGAAPA